MPDMTDESVFYLPVRYNRADAEAFYTRAKWYRLFGLLGRPEPPVRDPLRGRPNLPFLERIWMPWYAVEFQTEVRKNPGLVSMAIDAWSEMPVLFERSESLLEGTLDGAWFPPPFGPETAQDLARKGLFQVILRRRGQMNKPVIKECLSVQLFYMPLWVYYYRRIFRYIDVKLMDAYTGEASGSRIRNGVLNAMMTQRKAKHPPR